MSFIPCNTDMSDALIPIVPFKTYQEYEESLEELINAYRDMMEDSVKDETNISENHGDYGIRWTVKAQWLDKGQKLFLVFTKGLGKEWCETMNTMVVHTLDAVYRVFLEVCIQSGLINSDDRIPSTAVVSLIKREARFAIANTNVSPNNMCLFEELNFKYVHLRFPGWEFDYEHQGEHLPTAKVQAMKLAFAMALHPRLGAASMARVLSEDNVKMILSCQTCF